MLQLLYAIYSKELMFVRGTTSIHCIGMQYPMHNRYHANAVSFAGHTAIFNIPIILLGYPASSGIENILWETTNTGIPPSTAKY